MLVLDATATRKALSFDRLIPALGEMFAQGCQVPARHVHQIGPADAAHLTSLIMPAWLPGRYYGVKTINIAPGNAARALPGLHATYQLFDAVSGVPLALMDGDEITARRTAAASALAANWLARPDARHLLVVGAGRVARLLPHAYRAVRTIDRVTVWARSPDKAQSLARELQAQGVPATATQDLQRATAEADIVSCATLAAMPVIHGAWLQPGSHLDLIGSFTPAMREADDDCFAGSALYVDTQEALQKSGDLIGPVARGIVAPPDLRGTLEALARGTANGRRDDHERTVFKSVGSAMEDLAAAILVYESRAAATTP